MMKYFTRVNSDNLEEKITIDLDFYHDLPVDDKIYSLWIFIKSDKNLDALKSEITASLEKSHSADFVATRELDGWSELYYYASSERKFTTTINEIMSKYQFTYECGSHKDSNFKVYLETLYPDELEFHQIESRHIIETLESEGDDLEVAREVEHYAFFQTEANMQRFVESVKELGFHLKELVKQSDSDYSYGAILLKNHSVTLETVQNEISDLLEKIILEHGYYEGWSTTLVSEK